jgi:hypothetical protein
MPLQGQGAKLTTGLYQLSGSITVGADGELKATIQFTRTGGTGQGLNVDGEFFVMTTGADRLWFISSGASVQGTDNPAQELVNLEAVRMA